MPGMSLSSPRWTYQASLRKISRASLFKQEVETDLGTFNEEGFGMGLYIVSELLYKYNFQITVQGELDQGSLFVIRSQTN